MTYSNILPSFLLGLLLTACQHTSLSNTGEIGGDDLIQAHLNYDKTQFKLVPVPKVEDIFTLNDEHKNLFITYYHSPENANIDGHKRVFNFIEDRLVNFDFLGKTYTANQTVKNDAGNCLSLAIYTTALANLVGLETAYRRVNSAPIYRRYHNVLTLSSHVQTVLYAPKNGEGDIGRAKITIDYFPTQGNKKGGPVAYKDFVSMFYQNLAGDELVKENYDLAFSLLSQALELSPYNPQTLNTLAVLFKTIGQVDQAEGIYKFAIEHTQGSVNIFSNYTVLLEQQSRIREAVMLEEKISAVDDDNPYRWLDIADELFSQGKFRRALSFYKRAVDVGPYMHEGHFALAKTYYQLGEIYKAEKATKQALRYSYVPGDKDLYQAKLRMLESN